MPVVRDAAIMRSVDARRVSGLGMIGFALIALLTVLIAAVQVLTGAITMPEPDEGTGAHVFQLSVLLVLPLAALYVASADWRRPSRAARPIATTGLLLAAAFAILFLLEHGHM